jgi:hypothetical protein
MTKVDELKLVQFIHPGGEHGDDGKGLKAWNRDAHRRKFVQGTGRILGGTGVESLQFWTEWEAQSRVRPIEHPIENGPRFLHRPYYVSPDSYAGLQNTDPFVFGGFFYSVCQQHADGHATQMQHLARGSVILFGSRIDDHFAVDTVFVVDRAIWHCAKNFKSVLRNIVPSEYLDVALKPIYTEPACGSGPRCNEEECFRLYVGATKELPVEGMFSFFPTKPANQAKHGFARPCVQLNERITDALSQHRKATPVPSMVAMRSLWEEVLTQVQNQGLSIGVLADLPRQEE